MKRFICTLIVIGSCVYALTLVTEKINRFLVFSSSNTSTYKMYRLFSGSAYNEIPILGSSRAETAFVPSEFSPQAFNYGLSGSGQSETLLHLKAVCANKNATLVIINLDPWGMGEGCGFLGDYSLVYDATTLCGYDKQLGLTIADKIPGVRFYGKLRRNLASYLNSRSALTKRIEKGASLQCISRSPSEWNYIISKCEMKRFVLNRQLWNDYKEVLANNNDVRVVFVVSPVSAPWWERFTGKDELHAFLLEIAQIQNAVVIDMCSTNVDLYDLSCFVDLTHLNEKGARRFSRELKARLVESGVLKEE